MNLSKTTEIGPFSLHEINDTAQQLLAAINNYHLIAFYGEMGMGKTTLIKAVCQQMQVEDNIQSPTFSIVNEYHSVNGEIIYHFDFYRMKNEEEALDFGVEEYFYSGNYCFMEWAEKIPNLLPENTVKVEISRQEDEKRLITIHY